MADRLSSSRRSDASQTHGDARDGLRPQRGWRPHLRRRAGVDASGPGRSGSSRSPRPTSGRWTRSSTSTTLPGGGPATFGSRYIFGHIDRSTYSTQVRLNYTFKPDLNLDFYGEPFAASGRYDSLRRARRRAQPAAPAGRRRTLVANRRLQRALLPQQPRAALGMARRQHALPRLAAESRKRGGARDRASTCATCSGPSAPAATISSPSRRASGCRARSFQSCFRIGDFERSPALVCWSESPRSSAPGCSAGS